MNKRIAIWSSRGLIAAGLAGMVGGLVWMFAGAAASARQPGAESGSAPTAVAQPPQVGAEPETSPSGVRTGALGSETGSRGSQTGPSESETGSQGSRTGPPGSKTSSGSPESASDSLAAWATDISAKTGIPARALQGYGYAQIVLQSETPGCHLGWNTLAGIGSVESDHGRFGGATLAADGTETKAVIGPALDGSAGRRDLPATDHGQLTGDPVHDHAVGPMQLLPETWYQYADPGTNPQNIDAAAIAAGRYLCAGGRDLTTATGWWSAILAYNHSTSYADLVLHDADAYAIDTR